MRRGALAGKPPVATDANEQYSQTASPLTPLKSKEEEAHTRLRTISDSL